MKKERKSCIMKNRIRRYLVICRPFHCRRRGRDAAQRAANDRAAAFETKNEEEQANVKL